MSIKFEKYCRVKQEPKVLPFAVNGLFDNLVKLVLFVDDETPAPTNLTSMLKARKGLTLKTIVFGEWASLVLKYLTVDSRIYVCGKLVEEMTVDSDQARSLIVDRFFIDPRDIVINDLGIKHFLINNTGINEVTTKSKDKLEKER